MEHEMAEKTGWDRDAEGKYPMIRPTQMSVAEMGDYVGIRFEWLRKAWMARTGDSDAVQVGLSPREARDIAAALIRSAEIAEAGSEDGVANKTLQ
jgi:hypothetical protein